MTDNFIGKYNVPPEVTDPVLEFFKENSKNWKDGSITGGQIDKNYKDSKDYFLDVFNMPESCKPYLEALSNCFREYIEEYPTCKEGHNIWGIREKINLQYYPPGGGFKFFHCENAGHDSANVQRHLVFMTYLNTIDPDEGGGTRFLYQGDFNAVRGDTLIWPSAWTHTHRGIVSETCEKYIVTGWVSYELFPLDLSLRERRS
jgi:hypothetical protein